jgi:hypothetical protein
MAAADSASGAETGSGNPLLEFTAHEVDDRYYPAKKWSFTISFWILEGNMAVRWGPPPRTDGVVTAGAGSNSGQVHNLVAVAFYPVVLGHTRESVYLMSVWRYGRAPDAPSDKRYLVSHFLLYKGGEHHYERANQDPGFLHPVDKSMEHVQHCLRLKHMKVDQSVREKLWAPFGWKAARHADGYVVASPMHVPQAMPEPDGMSFSATRQVRSNGGWIEAPFTVYFLSQGDNMWTVLWRSRHPDAVDENGELTNVVMAVFYELHGEHESQSVLSLWQRWWGRLEPMNRDALHFRDPQAGAYFRIVDLNRPAFDRHVQRALRCQQSEVTQEIERRGQHVYHGPGYVALSRRPLTFKKKKPPAPESERENVTAAVVPAAAGAEPAAGAHPDGDDARPDRFCCVVSAPMALTLGAPANPYLISVV